MIQMKESNKDKHFTEDIKMPQKAWLLQVLQNESLGVFCSVNEGTFILTNKGNVPTIKISLLLSQMQF